MIFLQDVHGPMENGHINSGYHSPGGFLTLIFLFNSHNRPTQSSEIVPISRDKVFEARRGGHTVEI